VQSCRRSGIVTPHILNFGSYWKSVVSFIFRLVYSGENSTLAITCEVRRVPEPVRMLSRRDSLMFPSGVEHRFPCWRLVWEVRLCVITYALPSGNSPELLLTAPYLPYWSSWLVYSVSHSSNSWTWRVWERENKSLFSCGSWTFLWLCSDCRYTSLQKMWSSKKLSAILPEIFVMLETFC
jgi:hypothetical protein